MCFVFIWEQTATCATYSINWLVFITEMESVYSAVRTGCLNKAVCASYLKGWSQPLDRYRDTAGFTCSFLSALLLPQSSDFLYAEPLRLSSDPNFLSKIFCRQKRSGHYHFYCRCLDYVDHCLHALLWLHYLLNRRNDFWFMIFKENKKSFLSKTWRNERGEWRYSSTHS